MTPRLVLASGSPRRLEVLRQLGLEPEVRVSHVDEAYLVGETPAEHVARLAREKAVAVAADLPGALVVGGDTVVLDGDRVLGKPRDEADAVRMLEALAGREHDVLTGLAVAGAHGVVGSTSRATVRFAALAEGEAARYAASGEPLDKAGAYGIQGLGAALVDGIEGDYYTVVGFPVRTFVELLARAGWGYDFGRIVPLGGAAPPP